MYQLRLKIIVHLFSQITDIYVDGVGASFVVEVPEIVLYHVSGENPALVSHKIFEERELFGRESYILFAAAA